MSNALPEERLISIIIPCFNHGRYITEAIESVEKCDKSLYELIIINDGSTEPYTLSILKQLENDGYNIINQKNSGLGAARNAGIMTAKADFILPLDSDNKIYPAYLTDSLEIFNRFPEVAVVYGKKEFFGDTENHNVPQAHQFDVVKLVTDNYIDACAVIRKSALMKFGGFATNFPHQGIEDWDLWVNLASEGWNFYFLDKIVYSYRIRPDSMSSEMTKTKNLNANLSFFYAKHAPYLVRLLSEQDVEIRERKSWIPYLLRQYYRRIRYGTLKN